MVQLECPKYRKKPMCLIHFWVNPFFSYSLSCTSQTQEAMIPTFESPALNCLGLLRPSEALLINKNTIGDGDNITAMSLSSIRALLIDLSGTIHVENEVIPGAVEAVKRLREAKVPLKFVTNTTKVSGLLYNKLRFEMYPPVGGTPVFTCFHLQSVPSAFGPWLG